ncbi:MAG: glycosyltransferase [Patescibacteria group bacterium]
MNSTERRSGLSVLIHSPYPLDKSAPGGVSSYVQELVPHLRDLGCTVTTVAPKVKDANNDAAEYNLGRTMSIEAIGTKLEAGITFNKGLARNILSKVNPDIIIAQQPEMPPNSGHTFISAIPKTETGRRLIPIVGQFHAGRPFGGLDLRTRLLTELAQRLRRPIFKYGVPVGLSATYVGTLRNALDGWLAISHGTENYPKEFAPGNYEVIPNGIDVETFTPEGPKFEEWQKDGRKTIFFAAGRHDKRKGLEYLVKAFIELVKEGNDDIKLKITGEGTETKKIKELIAREGEFDIEFLGLLPREDLARAYRSVDLFVAPSLGGEGFTRVIAEARASGAPVLCTNIDGQTEAIGPDFEPFMAAPADYKDLKKKVKKILNLPEEGLVGLRMRSMEDARRELAWPGIAKRNESYYRRVLSEVGYPPKWETRKTFLTKLIPPLGIIYVSDSAYTIKESA